MLSIQPPLDFRNGQGLVALSRVIAPGHAAAGYVNLAIYPATHRRTVKVQLFVDFIRKRFVGKPEWDQALSKIPSLAGLLR